MRVLSMIFAAFVAVAVAAPMPGGVRDVDLAENGGRKDIHDAAQFAVEKMSEQCNCVDKFELVEVTRAQTQVVAGINYVLDLVVNRGGKSEAHRVTVYDRFGEKSVTADELVQ